MLAPQSDVVQVSKGLRRLVHGKKDLKYEMDGQSFCYKVMRVPSETEVRGPLVRCTCSIRPVTGLFDLNRHQIDRFLLFSMDDCQPT